MDRNKRCVNAVIINLSPKCLEIYFFKAQWGRFKVNLFAEIKIPFLKSVTFIFRTHPVKSSWKTFGKERTIKKRQTKNLGR